jgi:putative photosynthetic complex assembly protein
MSARTQCDTFPRAPLLGAGALVLLALTGAGLSRLSARPIAPDPVPTIQRDLRFADRADGAVVVYQAGDPAPLSVVTGQAGFLRGTMRALARGRRLDRVGADAAFRLSAWPDGRLTLDDLATGQRLELEAFGSANEAVYAKLLTAREGGP